MKTIKILDSQAGKVGSVKRLDNAIADKVIALGLAVHIKDVVEELNAKVVAKVVEKPKPVENKMLEVKKEVKKAPVKRRQPRKTTKK